MQLKAALIAFSGTCMMSGMSLAEVPDAKAPTTPHLDGSFYLSTGHIALDTGNTVDIGGTRTQLSFDGTLRFNDQWSLGLGITHIGESNKISFNNLNNVIISQTTKIWNFDLAPRYSFGNGTYAGI